MDEKMNRNGHGDGCRCDMCDHGSMMGGMWGRSCCCGYHRGHGAHLLVKIIVLLVVFWLGMELGELKAYSFGPGMMGGWGYPHGYMMDSGYGYGGGYGGYDQGTSGSAGAPAAAK